MKLFGSALAGRLALTTLFASLSMGHSALAITDAQEIAMGRKMAQEAVMFRAPELSPDAPASIRVQRIGARFARLSARRNIPYTYKVLNDRKTLNAFAAPGGPIFITLKLVNFARNDAELASILGHETAHIDQKHLSKRLDKYQRAQHSAALLSKKLLGSSGARKHEDFWRGLTTVGFALTELAYSRENESEADKLSARWMSKLGYDPRATVNIFTRMREREKNSVSDLQRYFSTHPPMADRVKLLQTMIEAEGLLKIAASAGGPRLNDITLQPLEKMKAGAR
ncbi:hypothetical protein EON80_16970 [bacterium]|nr:MAG: hypothetical protein EON80_16970 [bacterium]